MPITRPQQLLVRRGPGSAAGGDAALWNLLVRRIGALRSMLARAPTARVAGLSASFVARFAACEGVSRRTRPRFGAGGKAGARDWRYGRMLGCKSCSKSACRRLVTLSGAASRTRARSCEDWASTTAMAHGARLARHWIKQVVPWADASVDANGLAVQPQEQADFVAKERHDLWRVGRACQIDFWWCQQCSPSCHLHVLTTCVTSVVCLFTAHTAAGVRQLAPSPAPESR